MIPFKSVSEARMWWNNYSLNRECCLLIDFTDIGKGNQRRQISKSNGVWALGFPDNNHTR